MTTEGTPAAGDTPTTENAPDPAETRTDTAAASEPDLEAVVKELGLEPGQLAERLKASRKWEERAKANADAAKRLQEIEDAQKSETEKLHDALEAAKQDATTTKTELARFRAAIKHGLSEDDLDLLGTGTPEEIEARAERLAKRLEDSTKTNGARPVTTLGKPTDPAVSPDSWLRDIARG